MNEVYRITNIKNGKIYIGITNQGVSVRWCKHCSDSNAGSLFPIHSAIRKYGKENFQIEKIEETNDDYDILKEREKYWIQYFDSYNREKGYNLTLGGDGTFGRFHSEETKEKIRQKAIGRKASKEAKLKMSVSQRKVKRDYSELAKISNLRWIDVSFREEASKTSCANKSIIQYDLNNNFICEYRSANEAARRIGVKFHGNVSSCARGKLKSAYGFIWKYKTKEI